MKKTILILFILASVTYAQGFRGMGIKIGTTIADQDWDYSIGTIDPESRAGWNIGVFAEFLDLGFFSVVTELNYVQKGLTDLESIAAEPFLEGDVRLNYLNLAALAKVRMTFIPFSPYITAGPKLDIELNREAAVQSAIISNFKKERLGFKIGIGTELDLQAIVLLAEFLYDADFNELYNNNNLVINSRAYDIRVGIRF